jgi:AcrR family transcriptional regulator
MPDNTPPRRGRPVSEEGAAARRDRLCQAAITVAMRDGVAGLTTRAVAEEAGMSTAMLHYQFESKDGLLLALLEVIHADVYRELGASVVERCGLAVALGRMTTRYWRHVTETPALQRVQYELALHALTLEGGEALALAQYEGYVDEVVGALKKAARKPVKPALLRDIAGAGLALMDGLILQWLTTGNTAACERRMQLALRALQQAVTAYDE